VLRWNEWLCARLRLLCCFHTETLDPCPNNLPIPAPALCSLHAVRAIILAGSTQIVPCRGLTPFISPFISSFLIVTTLGVFFSVFLPLLTLLLVRLWLNVDPLNHYINALPEYKGDRLLLSVPYRTQPGFIRRLHRFFYRTVSRQHWKRPFLLFKMSFRSPCPIDSTFLI